MTTYYVGKGGSDGNGGTTWALRKLTLNGAEDIPVVANDTVYVGPGTYREQLTLDVDGTSGNEITYIADVTGINTDGIGGQVRITGSDDDIVATRDWCIKSASYGAFRIFQGFHLDLAVEQLISTHTPDGSSFDYCVIGEQETVGAEGWRLSVTIGEWGDSVCTMNNCITDSIVYLEDGLAPNTAEFNVSNTLVLPTFRSTSGAFFTSGIPGSHINNTFFTNGVDIRSTPSGGSTDLKNCVFHGCGTPFDESFGGVMTVDYCNYENGGAPGGSPTITNSNTWFTLPAAPLLYAGMRLPYTHGQLSEWSHIRHIAGTSEKAADLWGLVRPTTSSKKSWGAVQFTDISFESTIKASDVASVQLEDTSREYAYVRVRGELLTINVKVYREANYAGTNPQLVLRTPGVTTETDTDTGPAGQFNQLSATIAPITPYVLVELVSNNSSTTGEFRVMFDDFEMAP